MNRHTAVFLPLEDDSIRDRQTERRLSIDGSVVVRTRVSILPGPSVDGPDRRLGLKAALTVSQISVRVIFSSSWRREPNAPLKRLDASTAIVPLGGMMGTQQMIEPGPIGSDPLMWVQLVDGQATPLAAPVCLGRVSECPCHAESICPVPVTATAWLAARECNRNRGPLLDCGGELTVVKGISARLLFATGCDQHGAPSHRLGAMDEVILPPGAVLPSSPKLVMAGVGGRRCVSLLFVNEAGKPMGSEIPVGTCAQPA